MIKCIKKTCLNWLYFDMKCFGPLDVLFADYRRLVYLTMMYMYIDLMYFMFCGSHSKRRRSTRGILLIQQADTITPTPVGCSPKETGWNQIKPITSYCFRWYGLQKNLFLRSSSSRSIYIHNTGVPVNVSTRCFHFFVLNNPVHLLLMYVFEDIKRASAPRSCWSVCSLCECVCECVFQVSGGLCSEKIPISTWSHTFDFVLPLFMASLVCTHRKQIVPLIWVTADAGGTAAAAHCVAATKQTYTCR